MGGYGSGRRAEKPLISQMMFLNVRLLHRQGYLKPGILLKMSRQSDSRNRNGGIDTSVNSQNLTLKYNFREYNGKLHPVKTIVKIEWTACHFGGHRPWFRCPCCGRRVAILYGGKYFCCRICHNLAYPSENEQQLDRILRQANKIRRRLNCKPGIQNPILFKPKGMHQKTFDRLRLKVQMLENRAIKQLYIDRYCN